VPWAGGGNSTDVVTDQANQPHPSEAEGASALGTTPRAVIPLASMPCGAIAESASKLRGTQNREYTSEGVTVTVRFDEHGQSR
jgi:hypothetical protein